MGITRYLHDETESWCTSEIQQCPYICRDMGASGATVNTCNSVRSSFIHAMLLVLILDSVVYKLMQFL